MCLTQSSLAADPATVEPADEEFTAILIAALRRRVRDRFKPCAQWKAVPCLWKAAPDEFAVALVAEGYPVKWDKRISAWVAKAAARFPWFEPTPLPVAVFDIELGTYVPTPQLDEFEGLGAR